MTLYRVSFTTLVPLTRSVFVDDELDELDEELIIADGWFSLSSYLQANDEETGGWEDPEVVAIS